jgi:hypothetical protein
MKILKLKTGEIYKDGQTYPVFKTFWRKESKDGTEYYEHREVLFVNEVDSKPKEERMLVKEEKVGL